MMVVIGVDPDSDKHGVAIYVNGKLFDLDSINRVHLIELALKYRERGYDVLFSIEDVMANQSTWRARGAVSKPVAAKMGHGIGRLYQAMHELLLDLETNDFDYRLHKVSSSWKDASGRKMFEKMTGWNRRSNEDTRSAAYFGWLEVEKMKWCGDFKI